MNVFSLRDAVVGGASMTGLPKPDFECQEP